MVAKNKAGSIKIKFTPKNPGKPFAKILPKFQTEWEREMKEFANRSKDILKKNIPVGTRRRNARSRSTRESVTVTTSLSKQNLRGSFRISGNKTLKYLDQGTKPSPGRYVPVLNRRIKSGMHPGVSPLNIIRKSRKDIENDAKTTINNLKKRFKFSIRSAFR
jgi:hypothetical protein